MASASESERPAPLGDHEPSHTEAQHVPSRILIAGSASSSGSLWRDTARYRLLRELGKGGMGVVYEVFDRERGESVALKTLLDFDAAGLLRFKQEFRTLSDVAHPNLVRLYELVVNDTEGTFFTMELVRGVDFLSHVRKLGPRPTPDRSRVVTAAVVTAATRQLAASVAPGPDALPTQLPSGLAPAQRCSADVDKLRLAFRQLVEGVQALHAAGQLHRDLKPSNVLVAADGRVVILDLGVATSLRRVGGDRFSPDLEIVGTARYMAPEQALGGPPTPAADWYSVGVILYEALVGRPPFLGRAADVMAEKNIGDALPPSQCVQGVPEDLDVFCVDLLQRDPDARPTGLDVLRRLGASPSGRPRPSPAPVADPTRSSPLFGRDEQLGALREAFERVVLGHSVTVRLGGESGMGKSALAMYFLDSLAERGEALIFRGRAYERESLPYKALDSVVDEVSRHLVRSEEDGDPVSLPEDIGALARVFPVLRRVPSLAEAPAEAAADPRELRRRAFEALRELVTSLGKRQPLVIYIDDVQWGDADSASLVLALVRPPKPPPLLLLMTYRSKEGASSAFLNELRDGWPDRDAEERDLSVGPLRTKDAQTLALTFLEGSGDLVQRTARAVAREAHGSPFLVQELARSNAASVNRAEGETLTALTLAKMVGERLERLPQEARKVIELVAVGGRPLPVSVIGVAAGLKEGVNETLALLGARRFARMGQRDGRDVVEITHDRIRETIGDLLPAATLREHHDALARALEEVPGADAEAIALHWLGAGDAERAVRFAEDAAEGSAKKLAFDHAARLIRLALENTSPSSEGAQRLRVRLAQMLEGAGRSSDAADEYGKAAQQATGIERIELERSAAEQLVGSGRIDEGALALRRVLAVMGIWAPRSALGAVFALLVYRLWQKVLGLRFRDRAPEDVSREDCVRVETLRAVSMGLGAIDVVLGACMQARHLLMAMASGHRMQVLKAMSVEIVQCANASPSEGEREREMVEAARGLAARAELDGQLYFEGSRGLALYLRGRSPEACEVLEAVVVAYRRTPYSTTATNFRLFAVFACFFSGKLREEARRGRLLLRDVEDRGDVYTAVCLRTTVMVDVALAADDPEAARRHLRGAMAQWTQKGFSVQHWYAMFSEAGVDLYVGDGERAYARMQRDAVALKRSFLLHSRFVRGYTAYVRGCCAVASADVNPALRTARLGEARRLARQLEREPAGWTRAFASLVHASAANAAGDHTEAVEFLRRAVQRAEAAGMLLYAWAARYQLGVLLGGGEGAAFVAQAEQAMTSEGVRAPARMADFLVPGIRSAVPCNRIRALG